MINFMAVRKANPLLICWTQNFFSTSNSLFLKEIITTKAENITTVEGKYVTSPREPFLVKGHGCPGCPVCRLGLNIKHTDILILQQFVRSDGCMLPRRLTGLCLKQQRRISDMVSMAHKAGILYPPGSKIDPKKRDTYKKFNTYFDESTINTYGW